MQQDVRFSCEDRTFAVNKLFIIWLFALVTEEPKYQAKALTVVTDAIKRTD